MGSTNLSTAFERRYYVLVGDVDVLARVGVAESNTYVGSSMALSNVYRRVTLRPGDEVHALPGGVFAVLADATVLEVRLSVSDKHLFETVYLPVTERWPLERLAPLDADDARRPASYRVQPIRFDPAALAGRYVGRSIDAIVD